MQSQVVIMTRAKHESGDTETQLLNVCVYVCVSVCVCLCCVCVCDYVCLRVCLMGDN